MNSVRNRWLLGIAAVLAAVRFIIIPWIDFQAVEAEKLAVLTKRLDRATGVVQNQQLIAKTLAQVKSSTLKARARFPQAEDRQSFRLSAQQEVSDLIGAAGLNVKLFEWVMDGRAEDAHLEYSRARIQIEGALRQVVSTQAALEGKFPNMFVRELTVTSGTRISAPDDSLVYMILVVDFYYRPFEAGGI